MDPFLLLLSCGSERRKFRFQETFPAVSGSLAAAAAAAEGSIEVLFTFSNTTVGSSFKSKKIKRI